MNLISFDLPERIDELVAWLERQIVDLHLAELVAELAAIHQVQLPPTDSVAAVLGDAKLQEVLNNGLSSLSSNDIDRLLSQPYYLLDIQELVFSEGGPHWQQVHRSDELKEESRLSWQSLKNKLADNPHFTDGGNALPERELPWAVTQETKAWYRNPWPWIINLGTAAAIFVAVYFTFRVPFTDSDRTQPITLVWASPEALSKPATPEQYWQRLASVKQWWDSEKPTNKAQLKIKMGQLSQGCSVLILQDHKQLPPEEAQGLRSKCRDWANDLNGLIVELQGDNADFQEIQKKADALVNRLSNKLQSGMKS